jgi:hypothetical protein
MGKACAGNEVHFTISRWIAAMLSNRMVLAEIRGVSSAIMVSEGRCFVTAFVEYVY